MKVYSGCCEEFVVLKCGKYVGIGRDLKGWRQVFPRYSGCVAQEWFWACGWKRIKIGRVFLWRFFFMPCQYSFLLPSLLAKIEEINCRHLFGIGFLPLEHPHLGVGAGWIFTILGDCGGIWEAVFLPSVKK